MEKKSRPKKQQNNKKNLRNAIFIVLIVAFGFLAFASYSAPEELEQVPFSLVIDQANNGEISEIEIQGDELTITKQGEEEPSQQSRKEAGSSIYEQGLENRGVAVTVTPVDTSGEVWRTALFTLAPVILIGALVFWMMRSAQGQ